MLGMEEFYEPDEILRDVDAENEFRQEDDLHELNFETEREASEGLSILLNDIESPDVLFNIG